MLKLAAEGLSAGDIAKRLFLSAGTVRNYLSEAIQKLEAKNRIDAIGIAQREWLARMNWFGIYKELAPNSKNIKVLPERIQANQERFEQFFICVRRKRNRSGNHICHFYVLTHVSIQTLRSSRKHYSKYSL